MRKPFIALAAAGTLALGTVSALQAQVFPPVFPRQVPPPAVAPAPAATATVTTARTSLDLGKGLDQSRLGAQVPGAAAAATLRRLLADRGFGPEVVGGRILAHAPGEATPLDFAVDPEMDALIGAFQPEAWLIWTEAGRWWLWDYGAAAPADQRAETHETHVRRQAQAEGRFLLD